MVFAASCIFVLGLTEEWRSSMMSSSLVSTFCSPDFLIFTLRPARQLCIKTFNLNIGNFVLRYLRFIVFVYLYFFLSPYGYLNDIWTESYVLQMIVVLRRLTSGGNWFYCLSNILFMFLLPLCPPKNWIFRVLQALINLDIHPLKHVWSKLYQKSVDFNVFLFY